ncbi:uncharacterized protein Z519_07115 [Cladophialophora bantiana CBS 173.52]|uniref:Autophagy-related protein 14 n=1 Tax=Cladophialophora bantiana (strain ATCC 10958 / CBS 173.52 / CDC B-1940 / NIH 8579) TaxID=1442370 RepID=A0A0D2EQB0_CLAB1|nr:uncharacterized protein Z519_07115 [Cladophialophora bantiana CBS 173.52]KIW92131.1 hypothetical protein Z519_07115 [Cladophialophora bantiana CBS 173.52]
MPQLRRVGPSLSLISLRERFLTSEAAPPPKSLDAEVKDNETAEYEIEVPLSPTSSSPDSAYVNVETVKMDCPVCHKHLTESMGVNCANCVNNLLYNCRFDLARVLLEKESLGKKVEAIVGPEPEKPLDEETARLRRAWQAQQAKIDEQRVKEQEEDMRRELVIRQKELQEKKDLAEALRKNLEERRANLAAAKEAQIKNHKKKVEELKENNEKLKAQYDALHEKSVDTRAILCREAASLLRLHHSKKKFKDGTIKDRHYIAGLFLPDLKEINNMRCAELTAALGNVTRLVFLCSFYLGIRLPAEITLPHRDYPLATINTPLTSYLGQRITFPGSGSSLSAPGSPTASRMDLSLSPKPRPLYIGSDDYNESVAQFAKKEPLAFSYFIEGVSLLAWDVAWLSRTQGFVAGSETWEDICNIGHNLFQMILVPTQSTAARVLAQRNALNHHRRSHSTSSPVTDDKDNAFPARLGSYSHNSAHTFLGSAAAAGDNPSRHWRLNRYSMISDPLKKHLITEMNNAEWELLDQQEWNDGGEKMDEAVFIKTRPMDGKEYDDARSIMTPGGEEEGARAKGTSGWTKLKNREKA